MTHYNIIKFYFNKKLKFKKIFYNIRLYRL